MDKANKPADKLSTIKQAFLALEAAEAKLAAMERERSEPIAVTGIGCRFPGKAYSPQAFWKNLCRGHNAVTEIPSIRWDMDAYFDADHGTPGKMSTRWGAFIDDVDQFDAAFFGITPREARSMDPQQRILMEVAWQALEDAGHGSLEELDGSPTGVFVGINTDDYSQLMMAAQGPEGIDTYFASGSARSIVSGRIAYQFGLTGPAVSLDTACSSSLLAVHQACRSLLEGECRMALAAGVNLILSPVNSIALSKYQMMAPDGRCKVFDAAADGFVRGEGCGVVVLKRLSDAQAHRDHIYALIRGTAANQDGPSSSLTAPNGTSQVAVMRAALKRAKVLPADIGFVEAHGTGTALGDPIETRALGRCYADGRPENQPLVIGSIKTNIGHLEAASGIAGLIKTALVLHHREIPPNLHFTTPNPEIPWDRYPLKVPTARQPFPQNDETPLAAVTSLGFSGTNVHAILSSAPPIDQMGTVSDRPRHILTLSARTQEALEQNIDTLVHWLDTAPAVSMPDAAFSLAVGRTHHRRRIALVGDSPRAFKDALHGFRAGRPKGVHSGMVEEGQDPPPVAFLFTGQGAQYAGMGRPLDAVHPRFRKSIDACDDILKPLLGRSVREILFPVSSDPSADIHQTALTQPAMFAFEYALARLWLSWGVQPAYVMGHSLGEYVAACVSGMISLKDALTMVVRRAQLMQSVSTRGTMAAVMASEAQVARHLSPNPGSVSIAAVNGPEHVVISGAAADVERISESFRRDGVSVIPLTVSHAFHSVLMEPVLATFEKYIAHIPFGSPRYGFVSNVSGAVAKGDAVANPGYWRRHARETVRFMDGMKTLVDQGCRLFIEIGPKPVLLNMGRRCVFGEELHWLPSLDGKTDDWQCILNALAQVHLAGGAVDWKGFDEPFQRRRIPVPTHCFQGRRFWFDDRGTTAVMPRVQPGPPHIGGAHPLLGERLDTAAGQILFRSVIGQSSTAFYKEHRVSGTPSLPMAAVLEAVLSAAGQLWPQGGFGQLEQFSMDRAIPLPEAGGVQLEWILDPREGGYAFQLYSRPAALSAQAQWQVHASGSVTTIDDRIAGPAHGSSVESLEAIRKRCGKRADGDLFYDLFSSIGLDFGPAFHTLETVWAGQGEAVGRLGRSQDFPDADSGVTLSPLALDGALQVVAAALMDGAFDKPDKVALHLPVGVDRARLYRATEGSFWAHAVLREKVTSASPTIICDVRLLDDQSRVIARLSGVRLLPVHGGACGDASLIRLLYQPVWQPGPPPATPEFENTVSLKAIKQRAESALPELAGTQGFDAYERACDDMDNLVALYIMDALKTLGWHPEPGERVMLDNLAGALQIAPRHHRLLGRFLNILAEDGMLAPSGEGWRVVRSFPQDDPASLMEGLPPGPGARAIEFDLIVRCGRRLGVVLQAKADPLDILYQGEAFASVARLYSESVTARIFNGLLKEGVDEALGGVPPDRALRVLEIGAGTGGTTRYALEALAGRDASYLFTDISASFVHAARQRFKSVPGFKAQVLDIEEDPAAQGLADRQFDLVIAANVLHATADLAKTMRRVHGLTAPGGLLLLLEVTAPQRWIDMTFGLTEGWWKFTDHHRRKDSPLLSRGQWEALLGDVGFCETVAVPGPDFQVPFEKLRLEAMIVARRSDTRSVRLPPAETGAASDRNWLVLAENKEFGLAFCRHAEGKHIATTLLDLDTVFSTDDPVSSKGREILVPAAEGHPANDSQPERSRFTKIILLYDGAGASAANGDPDALNRAKAILVPVLDLLQVLRDADISQHPRLIFATRCAQSVSAYEPTLPHGAALWGMVRAVMLEHPEYGCRLIDLDTATGVGPLFNECIDGGAENQVALRGQKRFVLRLKPLRKAGTQAKSRDDALVQLDISERGLLENLYWRPVETRFCGGGRVKIQVAAASLNFRDVLNALGTYAGGAVPFGAECAGTVIEVGAGVEDLKAGDRVLAIATNSFGSEVVADHNLVWRIPDGIDDVPAGGLAIAYTTAAYALGRLAAIGPQHRVLIHAATGGVGLAAVHLAGKAGAQIFATAGSPEKRAYLERLGIAHVMDSRTVEFADQIMAATHGRGVDIVLNSLAGEFIEQSLGVTANGGTFLEIGRSGIMSPEEAGRRRPDIDYHPIDLTEEMAGKPGSIRPLFDEILAHIAAGSLPLLPCRVFSTDAVSDAFRFMARARHIGKIVLRWPGQTGRNGPLVRAGSTYWISGGLGGLGMFTAKWLTAQGADHLVLTGRNRPGPAMETQLDELRTMGVNLSILAADVSRRSEVEKVLAVIRQELPPLRGIFHAAGVLDDGVLRHQNWERFQTVLRPKLAGAWHLHRAAQTFHLDFMVFYSSVAGLLGSAGQANHCAANAFMDSLAHMRRAAGLPCLSIDWGVWGGAGAAVGSDVAGRAHMKGVERFSPETGVRLLELLMHTDTPQAAALRVDWRKYVQYMDSGGGVPPLLRDLAAGDPPRGAASQGTGPRVSGPARTAAAPQGLLHRLASAAANRKITILTEHVHAASLRILGLDASDALDLETPLHDVGLDSLMAVELRNALSRAVERSLPATLFFDYPSIAAVSAYLAGQLNIESDATPTASMGEDEAPASTEDLLRRIETMDDDDIDRLLSQKT
jgi:acyl transferase domain-containing protein/NADPH:quinone reductase-like Zn-dependent oxidoreductase/acyl carrier protein